MACPRGRVVGAEIDTLRPRTTLPLSLPSLIRSRRLTRSRFVAIVIADVVSTPSNASSSISSTRISSISHHVQQRFLHRRAIADIEELSGRDEGQPTAEPEAPDRL